MACMKADRVAVLLGAVVPGSAWARPWTGDFDFPVGAFLFFAAFSVYWLKGAIEAPKRATRTVVASIVAFTIGLGVPLFLMKFDLDLEGWVIFVWCGAWILAAKAGFFVAGVKDGGRD